MIEPTAMHVFNQINRMRMRMRIIFAKASQSVIQIYHIWRTQSGEYFQLSLSSCALCTFTRISPGANLSKIVLLISCGTIWECGDLIELNVCKFMHWNYIKLALNLRPSGELQLCLSLDKIDREQTGDSIPERGGDFKAAQLHKMSSTLAVGRLIEYLSWVCWVWGGG